MYTTRWSIQREAAARKSIGIEWYLYSKVTYLMKKFSTLTTSRLSTNASRPRDTVTL